MTVSASTTKRRIAAEFANSMVVLGLCTALSAPVLAQSEPSGDRLDLRKADQATTDHKQVHPMPPLLKMPRQQVVRHIELNNSPVSDVLTELCQRGGVTAIIDKSVKGKSITASFTNATLNQVLSGVLDSSGLSARLLTDNIMLIEADDTATARLTVVRPTTTEKGQELIAKPDVAAILTQAVAAYNRKLTVEAKALFEQVLQLSPNDSDASFSLGCIAEDSKDLSSAVKYYEQAALTNWDDSEIANALQQARKKLINTRPTDVQPSSPGR